MSDLRDLMKSSPSLLSRKVKEGFDWFRNAIRRILVGDNDDPIDPKDELIKINPREMEIGKLYMMQYDPFHADKLPYWDEWPLIFVIGPKPAHMSPGNGDGLLAINLHYLPPKNRLILMDALIDIRNNDRFDDSTKLNISYELLKGSSQYVGYKQCVKVYLYSQIRRSYYVQPNRWSTAVLLPTQQWVRGKTYTGSFPY